MSNIQLYKYDARAIAAMLPEESAIKLVTISSKLEEAWNKRQIFRTLPEMKYSVLSNEAFPTIASKYWQCIREQTTMLENMVVESFAFRRNEIRIKEIQHNLSEPRITDFAIDRLRVDLDEALFKRAQFEEIAKDRCREILEWEKLKNSLDDGTFDTSNIETSQETLLQHQRT